MQAGMNFLGLRASKGFVLAALSMWIVTASAAAQPSAEQPATTVQTARLGNFSHHDRELLAPQLERGPVALVEFAEEAELPAILVAMYVRAPAARLMEVISDPARYPSFMPALDSVDVLTRRDATLAYEWTWTTAIFTLTGTNVMTVYPRPEGRRDRPWRVESRAIGGDLGTGRIVWRIYPQEDGRSLLVLSSRLDLRDANYVTRSITSAQRSVSRTLNLSLALVMTLGARREAERLEGHVDRDPSTPLPPLARPEIDLVAFAPMLARGDLLLMTMQGDRLDQIAAIGRPGTSLERVREVMNDPREFGPALIPGSYANVTRENGNELDFDWGVDIPLLGASGKMRLVRSPTVNTVTATEGGLEGGVWHFDTAMLPWQEPVVLSWARFDLASANWILEAIVSGSRDFGYGLTAGTELMMLRAIRLRAWRVHEARAAAEAAAAQ
jgi:carbon monoxide dehydrogenase subunit G